MKRVVWFSLLLGGCFQGEPDKPPGTDPDDTQPPDSDDTGCEQPWYSDVDGDGYGAGEPAGEACTVPAGASDRNDDCDDTDASVHPDAVEICDGQDNDCDGLADDDDGDVQGGTGWYLDGDGDGYGVGEVIYEGCDPGGGYAADATDCDDGDPAVHPGATEVCATLGVDDDCDGLIDLDDPDLDPTGLVQVFVDGDGDGYGDASMTTAACGASSGWVEDGSDCDDAEPLANPGMDEICNDGIDNDCDGTANGCGLSGNIVLSATTATAKIEGEAQLDQLGADGYLTRAGDVDGDGFDDLLLASAGNAGVAYAAGSVFLFYGPLTGTVSAGDADVRFDGTVEYEAIGLGVLGDFDLDGDGGLDLGMTSDWPSSRDRAFLVFTSLPSTSPTMADADIAIWESSSDVNFAQSTARGDLDGDGQDDLLLGDMRYSAYDTTARVFYGPLTAGSYGVGAADFVGTGTSFGYEVEAGDLDGDGIDDLIIGAPYAEEASGAQGAVYVFAGGYRGTVDPGRDADAILLDSTVGQSGLGMDMSSGDVDGDGVHELVMGAPYETDGGDGAGAVFVALAPPAGTLEARAVGVAVYGTAAYDSLGISVAAEGDITSDGVDDLLVGVPGSSHCHFNGGVTYLYTGIVASTLTVHDHDAALCGESAYDECGTELVYVGDVDGDGGEDLLVGASETYDGGYSVGEVFLVSGGGL